MSSPETPTERIFYDGDCGVCHWAVGFVARRDPKGEAFRFAPLDGESFAAEVPEEERDAIPDSLVVLTRDGELLLRSRGMVHILRRLKRPWPWLGTLLALVPRVLGDFGYDRFAAVRHRLVRRPEGVCPLVPPELARRFDP